MKVSLSLFFEATVLATECSCMSFDVCFVRKFRLCRLCVCVWVCVCHCLSESDVDQ